MLNKFSQNLAFQKKLILENFNYSHYLTLIDFCKTKNNDVPSKIGILLLNLKNTQKLDQNSLKLKVRKRPRWTSNFKHSVTSHGVWSASTLMLSIASSRYLISMGSAKSIIFDIQDSLIFCTRIRIVPSTTNITLAISFIGQPTMFLRHSHGFSVQIFMQWVGHRILEIIIN